VPGTGGFAAVACQGGRRIKKTVTNSGDLDGITVYLYHGYQLIEILDTPVRA
jgi:hypothetical protein